MIRTIMRHLRNIRGQMIRIGNGIDVHRLIEGNGFLLGGFFIKSKYSIEAHSDGDILLHAISDAILGAISYRDIGYHFPDNMSETKNIDSKQIFKFCLNELKKRNYKINNIDNTIILEKPKISPHVDSIIESISEISFLDKEQISVKSTTCEKMGFVGKGQGIIVSSSVLIEGK